jgi:polyisoprenoid-binding protein YceI
MSTVVPYTQLTGVYTIDPAHSTLGFSLRHAMIANVRGRFGAFEGLVKLDGYQPSRSEAYMSVQTGSIDTGSPERDTHLAGPDFLDAATYPLMAFRSAGLADRGDGQFRLTGHLRIKDVELPLHIHLAFDGATRDESGDHRVGFSGRPGAPLRLGSRLEHVHGDRRCPHQRQGQAQLRHLRRPPLPHGRRMTGPAPQHRPPRAVPARSDAGDPRSVRGRGRTVHTQPR